MHAFNAKKAHNAGRFDVSFVSFCVLLLMSLSLIGHVQLISLSFLSSQFLGTNFRVLFEVLK